MGLHFTAAGISGHLAFSLKSFFLCPSADKMTPSPVTSQATTQSGNHARGPSTPQTPGNHPTQKGSADRTQHQAGLPQPPVSGNADSIAADLEHENLPDDFNFGVLEGDHSGGTDGVEGALDVSFVFQTCDCQMIQCIYQVVPRCLWCRPTDC